MTEHDIEYFKAHHSSNLLDAINFAYNIWYREEYKKDDSDETKLKLLHFLKEKCFFTDKDIYSLLALEVLSVWIKKADLFYVGNKRSELLHIAKSNSFGDVHFSINVELNPNLPETIEEYITRQNQLYKKNITEVSCI